MNYPFPFQAYPFADLIDSYLPDFVLAFTFFTAVIFAVLERRFGNKRPAVAMSAALGLALTIGLLWWEVQTGRSIRDLGPLAAGFALILLASVLYQSIKHVGGGWAGATIAFGASILIGWLMGVDWPVDTRALQTVVTVVLVVGVIAFLIHRRGALHIPASTDLGDVRHDMTDLYQNHHVAERLTGGFRRLRDQAASLIQRPEGADDVMLQLRRILPTEGWLTQRMARLRARAHQMREGHVARIEEIQRFVGKMPPLEKRKLSAELQGLYRELKFDVRLERLEKAVAETERRIGALTRGAQQYLANHEYQKVSTLLEEATKLQAQNAKLIRRIEHTESRLLSAAQQVARKAGEVKGV